MKPQLYILTISIFLIGFTSLETYVDPTGTYHLGEVWGLEEEIEEGKEIKGYFGKIKVKTLSRTKIVIEMDINSGAPYYNSGLFIDTLSYDTNRATGTTPEYDPSCKLTFDFSKEGVDVNQEADNLSYSCGFGSKVIADDFFVKKSSKEPVFN